MTKYGRWWAVALLAALLAACAAPRSDQGQGGSTGPTPQVVVNVGTNGGVTVTNTTAPTAAPASNAQASQTATAEIKPAVGTDAIKAAVPGGVTTTPTVR